MIKSQLNKEHKVERQLARKLYDENQQAARELKPELRKFFKDCQLYFYTTAEPSTIIDHELKILIQRLHIAQSRNMTAEEVLGMNGENYCKKTLRTLNVDHYHSNADVYSQYILLFFLFTFSIYSAFEFSRGLFHYRSLGAALNMPVPVSILGLPLQILTVITALFFLFHFRRNISFDNAWFKDNNILYLLASIFAGISILIIPFISLYYHVFVINLPVWLFLLTFTFVIFYTYILPKINIEKYLVNQNSLENKVTVSEEQVSAEEHINSPLSLTESNKPANPENLERTQNIWETIRSARPLLTRRSYRQEIKKQHKENKDEQ